MGRVIIVARAGKAAACTVLVCGAVGCGLLGQEQPGSLTPLYSTFDGPVLVAVVDDDVKFDYTPPGAGGVTKTLRVKKAAVCPKRNALAMKVGDFIGGLISGLFTLGGLADDK